MHLSIESTLLLAPPTSSEASASWREMIQASPSMEVEDCLFWRAMDSLDSRSKPSSLTWAARLGWGQGVAMLGQWAADLGHTPWHLKAGVIWTTYL